MIYEYACQEGHRTEEVLPVALRDNPGPCTCGARRKRLVSKPSKFVMPQHMSDENISSNARHREWLATPEARAMNLERASEDPEGPEEEPVPGTDPLELFDVIEKAADGRAPHYVEKAAEMLETTPEDAVARISRAEAAGSAQETLAALTGNEPDSDPIATALDRAKEAESAGV